MYCYKRLLQINWTQKETNVEIRIRLDIKEDLMQAVSSDEKEIRSTWTNGHVCRMENNRKIKDVMMRMMERTGRLGRASREWLDDIRDWCQTPIPYVIQPSSCA